jgi:hypothetical protein
VNATSLRDSIPPIKRARGCYLYDFKGRRYHDLYRQNGAALLGHRPANLTRVMKQVMAKGLIADLPSVYEGRLRKAVQKLLPAYKDIRVVCCEHRAVELAALYLQGKGKKDAAPLYETLPTPVDPLVAGPGDAAGAAKAAGTQERIAYWRPLCPPAPWAETAAADVVIPLLPLVVGGAPVVVCFKEKLPPDFPASDHVSPLLLAGLIRAGYDLLLHRMPDWYTDELLVDAPGWEQRGPYIMASFAGEKYPGVFHAFLAQGFLLSPNYPGPSLLPWEVSPGELKKMLKLFQDIPGE